MAKRKLSEDDARERLKEAGRKLRLAKARESGSTEFRGKNQDEQKRAMWAKDPDADAIGGRD